LPAHLPEKSRAKFPRPPHCISSNNVPIARCTAILNRPLYRFLSEHIVRFGNGNGSHTLNE